MTMKMTFLEYDAMYSGDCYQLFGGICYLHSQDPEDEGNTFFQNAGNDAPNCRAPPARRQ
jgi:hypothetical protein